MSGGDLEPPIASREVELSKRAKNLPRSRYGARGARKTQLHISAKKLTLQIRSASGERSKNTVVLNVVRVFEDAKESINDPVEWLLLTSEPVDTVSEIEEIVDIYRARWIIEEYFKGLKTGCRLEERLLDNAESWHRLVAILLPVATSLLNLRLSREKNAGESFFTEIQMKILKIHAKENGREIKTIEDAQLQMAQMGGHIAANGPPGWMTLFRGYQQLIALEAGWALAKRMKM